MEYLTNGTPVAVSRACRFGQDALLLARFCGVHTKESACDLGTGCGIIPLCWHDEGHRGPCLAIERSPEAAGVARASLSLSDAAAHISLLQADLRDVSALRPYAQTRHVVACNPPYFRGGCISPNGTRAAARHELTCTIEDVCRAAFLLLRDGGRLCLCQRPERLADVLCALRAARLEPKRLQFCAASPAAVPWLFLVDARKNRAPGMTLLPLLRHAWTAPGALPLDPAGRCPDLPEALPLDSAKGT